MDSFYHAIRYLKRSCIITNSASNEIYNIGSLSEYVLPEEHRLLDAYPNPFNPTTSISLELADYAHTKIDIYNINGQLIEKIVDQRYDSGYYSFDWNAEVYKAFISPCRVTLKVVNDTCSDEEMQREIDREIAQYDEECYDDKGWDDEPNTKSTTKTMAGQPK